MDWTDEKVEQLTALWSDGKTGEEIADIMGAASRCVIIGKAHRLGLPARKGPSAGARNPCRRSQKRAPMLRQEMIADPEPVTLEGGEHVGVMTVHDGMCRWPIGDPMDSQFHFCGRDVASAARGKPYCEAHSRKGVIIRPKMESGRILRRAA